MKHTIFTKHHKPDYPSKRFRLPVVLLFLVFFIVNSRARSQNCTINAGTDQQTCITSATLRGNVNGSFTGNPNWTFVSGPVVPTITSPASLTSTVTGMTVPGDYIFRISQNCQLGGIVTQTVKVTANPKPVFTAGTDFIIACGNYNLSQTMTATLPAGWTGGWSVSSSGFDVTSLFSFSNINSPTSSVSLAPGNQSCAKAGSYTFTWTITSPNGGCTYNNSIAGTWSPGLSEIDFDLTTHTICLPGNLTLFDAIGCAKTSLVSNATYSVALLSAPAGFAGTLTATELLAPTLQLGIGGFTLAGTYTFNVILTAPPCGNKSFGIFTVIVGAAGQNVSIISRDPDQTICSSSLPPSVTFNYVINTASSTGTITATVPPGADPVVLTETGAGTTNRSFTIASNTNWKAGVYLITVDLTASGPCASGSKVDFKLLVFNSAPLSLSIPDVNVCMPASGLTTSATINFPALPVDYAVNGGFDLVWKLTLISSTPGGSAPGGGTFFRSTTDNRPLILPNIRAGSYVYKLEPNNSALINYIACGGSPLSGNFTINVYNQAAANAGTSQNILCIQNFALAGNTPALPSFGTWTQVGGPATVQFSNIHDPNATTSTGSGTGAAGTYQFRWTVTDPAGSCSVASSDVNITTQVACAPLPVSLLSFTAQKKEELVLVKWLTATEQNAKQFIVEWCTDGIHWQPAGAVAANGNSNTILQYNFLHTSPAKGINYYRLKQQDNDGHEKYSAVVSVRMDKNSAVSVLPNPVVDNLHISKAAPGSLIELLSATGKILMSRHISGENETIDMKNCMNGFYILKITSSTGGTISTFKIIKQ
jgi:Secretion system C-terminal sorting domain